MRCGTVVDDHSFISRNLLAEIDDVLDDGFKQKPPWVAGSKSSSSTEDSFVISKSLQQLLRIFQSSFPALADLIRGFANDICKAMDF